MTKGSWNNLAKPATVVPVLEPLVTREEAVVELFDDATRNSIPIHLVQVDPLGPDPYRCIAVVGGHAIAEVLVTVLLRVESSLELNLVAQARANAIRAGRPDPFGSTSTSKVPEPVEPEPTDGIIPEVEAQGIETFIGDITDATAAERASRRDRRAPTADWLSEPPLSSDNTGPYDHQG